MMFFNKKKKYDLVYSLGAYCGTALYMTKHQLRLTSGPFDWLPYIPFEKRIDYIINDFIDFLNFEDLNYIDKKIYKNVDKKHSYYKNKRNGFVYFHDFPENEPLEKSFRQVKERYNRRIERFYKYIYQSEKILFIWFSQEDVNTLDRTLIDSYKKIKEKFDKDIDFLIIEQDKNLSKNFIKKCIINKNIVRYYVNSIIYENKNKTILGNDKLINKIFSKYSINITFFDLIRKICIYPITIFYPIKSIRKKLRYKYIYPHFKGDFYETK